MKRIIVFYGNDLCYNTLNIFAEKLASGLSSNGFDVVLVNAYTDSESLKEEIIKQAEKGIDAAIAFNADGRILACRETINELEIPLYDWILDHPCDHIKVLEAEVNNLNVIVLDQDHLDFIKRHIDNVKSTHMIPLGGLMCEDLSVFSEESFANRKYGLIFTGSYVPYYQFEESILSLPDRMRKMTVMMIEYMLTNRNANNEEAFNFALREVIGTDQIPSNVYRECAYYTSNSNIYVRHFVREEILRYIVDSGVKIDIFGPGWERLGFDKKKNVVLHDRIDYLESAKVCSEAKLSLNIMPWFKNGLHDRIPTAMMNGSAVVSDSSRYINEVFCTKGQDREIILFDINNPQSIPECIIENLSDEEMLYRTAKYGREKALSQMKWENRANDLKLLFDM